MLLGYCNTGLDIYSVDIGETPPDTGKLLPLDRSLPTSPFWKKNHESMALFIYIALLMLRLLQLNLFERRDLLALLKPPRQEVFVNT